MAEPWGEGDCGWKALASGAGEGEDHLPRHKDVKR